MRYKLIIILIAFLLFTPESFSQSENNPVVQENTVSTGSENAQVSKDAPKTQAKPKAKPEQKTRKPASFENLTEYLEGKGNALQITATGMGVVFVSLTILYFLLVAMAKVIKKASMKKLKKDKPDIEHVEIIELSGEVNAAIALAIHLHLNSIHDQENTVLTIKRVAKSYSPWSSKIYNLRHHPKNW
ncbi:MAG: OadG family protein [Ignavibacteriaceae bacterium]|nr:OadG family protein [Ignavibacteriaceae bacterium]